MIKTLNPLYALIVRTRVDGPYLHVSVFSFAFNFMSNLQENNSSSDTICSRLSTHEIARVE
jgi:hypothetical protein